MNEPTDKHASRWDRKKARTHHRLLEAAEHLFRERGFDETTVEDIAEMADVAKGTFFNYFESKEGVLGAILHVHTQSLLDTPPGAGQPAETRIRLLFEMLWAELYPYRHIAQRMIAHAFAQAQKTPPPQDDRRLQQVIATLVRQGQTEGHFRPNVNPDLVAVFLLSSFFRLFIFECAQDAFALGCGETAIQEGLELFYHGLLVNAQP